MGAYLKAPASAEMLSPKCPAKKSISKLYTGVVAEDKGEAVSTVVDVYTGLLPEVDKDGTIVRGHTRGNEGRSATEEAKKVPEDKLSESSAKAQYVKTGKDTRELEAG